MTVYAFVDTVSTILKKFPLPCLLKRRKTIWTMPVSARSAGGSGGAFRVQAEPAAKPGEERVCGGKGKQGHEVMGRCVPPHDLMTLF